MLLAPLGYLIYSDLSIARNFLAEPRITLICKILFVAGLLPASILYAFLVRHTLVRVLAKRP